MTTLIFLLILKVTTALSFVPIRTCSAILNLVKSNTEQYVKSVSCDSREFKNFKYCYQSAVHVVSTYLKQTIFYDSISFLWILILCLKAVRPPIGYFLLLVIYMNFCIYRCNQQVNVE